MLGSTDPVFLLVLLAEHRSTFKMLTLSLLMLVRMRTRVIAWAGAGP